MESGASSSSLQTSMTTNDELEGIEVAEFDANVLWELLHDQPREEEAAPKQAVGIVDFSANSVIESYWCSKDDDNDNNNAMIGDLNWSGIVEETSLIACNHEMWHGEPCMEEMNLQFLEIGDYSFSHTGTAIMCDEIGYIRLWHDDSN